MAYTIEVLPTLSVICVTFSEQVMLPERARALEDVLRHRDAIQARSLLVDMAQATVLEASHVETFEYATRLACQPTRRKLHVAYVGDGAGRSGIEAIAAFRGDIFRRFRTRRAALGWIAR
jgi:hypothetical protein